MDLLVDILQHLERYTPWSRVEKQVSNSVFTEGSVMATFAYEGYAAFVFKAELDLKEDNMRLHIVFFAALGTEVSYKILDLAFSDVTVSV